MDNIFPTPEQEAQRAANELYEIKVQVRDLLSKLNQIEKRLKAIAPSVETKKTHKEKPTTKRILPEQHFKDKYEKLSNEFREDAKNTVDLLQSMDKDELEGLVKFLGLPITRNPSQKKLVELTVGRLKESRLLRS